MWPIPRGWLPNLQYEPSITFSEQSNNVLSFLRVSKMKFPPTLPHLLCRPGGAGAPCWGRTYNRTDHGIGELGSPANPSGHVGNLSRHHSSSASVTSIQTLGTTFSPFFTTHWAQRQRVLCKGYPTAKCAELKGIQNAKYGYTDFSGGLKLRGSRAISAGKVSWWIAVSCSEEN